MEAKGAGRDRRWSCGRKRRTEDCLDRRNYLRAHRTATGMDVNKAGADVSLVAQKGGLNTRMHAICDSQDRPLKLLITARRVSDDSGA